MSLPAVRVSIRAVAVMALLVPSRLEAQCADGSPPPCRSGVAPRPIPIDPNRVAVIPFRVAAADTLLGEGFAELLAPEFTGEGGPRSIDMSSTLAAWRRAGGGLRSPLSQDDALRIARQLGAGVLCQGSIVGVGSRLTITATLLDATSGRPIGNPARASGAADSMEVLLDRVATGLLGAGERARVAEAGRLTNSPAALRAYFEGMALRRRGHREAAGRAFEASFAADTMFASAAFQRWLIGALLAGSPEWGQRAYALKTRLTPGERILVDASIEPNPNEPRPLAEINAALLRAAQRVESPEAWYLYGDDVYHDGLSIVGPDSVWPIARRAFEHAMSIDSLPIGVGHLLNIALRSRDTSLVRILGRFYEPLDGEDSWSNRWVIAGALGDAAQIARLRQVPQSGKPNEFTGIGLMAGLDAPVPTALLEEGFRLISAASAPEDRSRNLDNLWLLHRARGRPVAAERSAAGQGLQHWRISLGGGFWTAFSGDLADDDAFMRDFGASRQQEQGQERRRQCVAARLTAQRGHADSLDIGAVRRTSNERCAQILAVWKAFAANTLTDADLVRLDSIVTASLTPTFMGFEHRLLARIYESRGDTTRALRAVRLYPRDFTAVWLAPTLREEGRYYLMARDTANAIRSYQHFLDLRAEAEAPYIAERDSIRALVSTLTRRR